MAGKGGGAWKVAYADFVTAMMAFFMVMWLVGQKEDVKEAIAQYFQDPMGEADPTDGSTENAPHPPPGKGHGGKAKKGTPSKDPSDAESRKPRVLTIHGGERTAVATVVPFENEGLELSEEGKRQLDRILPKLAGMPQKIEVRGHASRRASDGSSDAWMTSYQRCLTVMQYLESQGIEPRRIRLTQAGAHEPFSLRAEGGADRNARVEVFLLSELADDLMGTPEERAARFNTVEISAAAGN
jgi:chemotaxis protein MotB